MWAVEEKIGSEVRIFIWEGDLYFLKVYIQESLQPFPIFAETILGRFSNGIFYYPNNNINIKYGDLTNPSRDSATLGDGKINSIIFITDQSKTCQILKNNFITSLNIYDISSSSHHFPLSFSALSPTSTITSL